MCYIFSQKQCEEYAPKITIPLFEENSNIPNIIEKECIKILSSKLNNYKEKVTLAKKRGYQLTKNQLSNWGLKYHKLILGKPSYDVIVDDKSYNYNTSWYKKLK